MSYIVRNLRSFIKSHIKKTKNVSETFANLKNYASLIGPGLLLTVLVAMAAQFLSDHYGAPVMLMAILLGMPLQFLSQDERTGPGIAMASRVILRIGVALLGIRVSGQLIQQIGSSYLSLIVISLLVTIVLSVLILPIFGKDRMFGFLTGGSVAICGASAAMAISTLLPNRPQSERDLSFTVISVTLLSTIAMISYPIIAQRLELAPKVAGLFLGGTIHDVAQVVGAGYSISEEVGDISTVVKLFRVAMLAPVVFIGALILRHSVPKDTKRPPLLPMFVFMFLILAVANSLYLIPESVKEPTNILSRAMLVTAVAGVGMRTSILELKSVGSAAMMIIVGQTLFLASMVLGGVMLIGTAT